MGAASGRSPSNESYGPHEFSGGTPTHGDIHFTMTDLAADWATTFAVSFALVGVAEMGDKSQLICLALAARYRALPVFLGAASAFAILNLLAVAFGASIAAMLPDTAVAAIVGVLFAVFGVHALANSSAIDPTDIKSRTDHGVLATTFVLIVASEFGDKTQIAVAGLSSNAQASAVWLGATLALAVTSAIGVYAGIALIRRLPIHWLHRASGTLFLILAAYAFYLALRPPSFN